MVGGKGKEVPSKLEALRKFYGGSRYVRTMPAVLPLHRMLDFVSQGGTAILHFKKSMTPGGALALLNELGGENPYFTLEQNNIVYTFKKEGEAKERRAKGTFDAPSGGNAIRWIADVGARDGEMVVGGALAAGLFGVGKTSAKLPSLHPSKITLALRAGDTEVIVLQQTLVGKKKESQYLPDATTQASEPRMQLLTQHRYVRGKSIQPPFRKIMTIVSRGGTAVMVYPAVAVETQAEYARVILTNMMREDAADIRKNFTGNDWAIGVTCKIDDTQVRGTVAYTAVATIVTWERVVVHSDGQGGDGPDGPSV